MPGCPDRRNGRTGTLEQRSHCICQPEGQLTMRAPFILTSLLATLGTGLAAAAADPVDMEALRHMTAAQARTWAKRQIARQEATRAQRSTAKVDIVPPVLTAIEAPTSVDALAPASSFI